MDTLSRTTPHLFSIEATMRHAAREKRYCLLSFLTDALTFSRLLIALTILWLGWMHGRAAFPQAILLATLGWITDAADGFIARRNHCRTRLGAVDFPIDVSLTWASFAFLGLAGFLTPKVIIIYSILAGLTTLWFRRKAVLVLFMRGVDLTLLGFALRYALLYVLPLLGWLLFLAWLHRRRLRTSTPAWLHELWVLFFKRTS